MPELVSFVTGAASGIGRSTALRLAARGDPIAAFDRAEHGLAETARAIRENGGVALELLGDVSAEEDVAAAFANATSELGPIASVAACAGVEVTGTVADMTPDDWHRVLSVNLTGVFNTARHAVRAFRASTGGAFVAISSDGGVQGAPEWGAYCATKHGVIGMVRCMALDHGPEGIRANAVCPALTETPMADRIFDAGDDPNADREAWTKVVPAGRLGRPADVAAAVAFLTSPDSDYVNGHALVVDGGATAGYFG
jgi:meso-butanediol dehydrogenase/(S,S)-butanediol dehydrogenase/diacetyl reductase